jgi:DNA-binding response OmpR family regulator
MTLTILVVEPDQAVSDALKDTLEAEGWRAVVCTDGAVALLRLAGGMRYDLLITDNYPPDVDGLEIARRARRLEHRSDMLVVMLCGVDCRRAAYRAGVDMFLKKPEGIGRLVETVRELTSWRRGRGA